MDVDANSSGFDFRPSRSSFCGRSMARGRAGTMYLSSTNSLKKAPSGK